MLRHCLLRVDTQLSRLKVPRLSSHAIDSNTTISSSTAPLISTALVLPGDATDDVLPLLCFPVISDQSLRSLRLPSSWYVHSSNDLSRHRIPHNHFAILTVHLTAA